MKRSKLVLLLAPLALMGCDGRKYPPYASQTECRQYNKNYDCEARPNPSGHGNQVFVPIQNAMTMMRNRVVAQGSVNRVAAAARFATATRGGFGAGGAAHGAGAAS